MAIRGMMGEVFHGNVLENVAKARYVLPNGMYVRPTQGWVSGWVHSYSIKIEDTRIGCTAPSWDRVARESTHED